MMPPTDREMAFRGVSISDKWAGHIKKNADADADTEDHEQQEEQPAGEDEDPALTEQKNAVDGKNVFFWMELHPSVAL